MRIFLVVLLISMLTVGSTGCGAVGAGCSVFASCTKEVARGCVVAVGGAFRLVVSCARVGIRAAVGGCRSVAQAGKSGDAIETHLYSSKQNY